MTAPMTAPMSITPCPRASADASARSQAVALAADSHTLSASRKRAQHPAFVATWSLQALLPSLPLVLPLLPAEESLPPSPKRRYLSEYRYPGLNVLLDILTDPTEPTRLARLSDFELALHLIDFAALERPLAQIYVPSPKGQTPYHPVSLFLGLCLRREQRLGWRGLARLLGSEHGAGWRRLFGFGEGQTPSASALRAFHHALGAKVFDELCRRFVTLLRLHGLFPEASTYPGDSATRGIAVTQDGMLHQARSRPSCQLATDACYQSLRADPEPKDPEPKDPEPKDPEPKGAPSRPCRARDKGHTGCACDSTDCQQQCRRASRHDPEARFIHYAGHNHKHGDKHGDKHGAATSGSEPASGGPNAAPTSARGADRGLNLFGYRSVADRAIDDRFFVAWNLQTGLYPANKDERTIFRERLTGLEAKYPDLKVGEWLDDSAVGYGECLAAIWTLGALRMVDIRADKSDQDPEGCLARGYDGFGRPLCPHGYTLRSNGYDYERRRTKYVCDQVCRRESLVEGGPIQPVTGCPYLEKPRPLGMIVNVGRTLPDGSVRLAREIPYGSTEWKARYARRNLSESRNGQLEMMGLKRMRAYGLEHNTRDVQLADFLGNLRTLGRLVREATGLRTS